MIISFIVRYAVFLNDKKQAHYRYMEDDMGEIEDIPAREVFGLEGNLPFENRERAVRISPVQRQKSFDNLT